MSQIIKYSVSSVDVLPYDIGVMIIIQNSAGIVISPLICPLLLDTYILLDVVVS